MVALGCAMAALVCCKGCISMPQCCIGIPQLLQWYATIAMLVCRNGCSGAAMVPFGGCMLFLPISQWNECISFEPVISRWDG